MIGLPGIRGPRGDVGEAGDPGLEFDGDKGQMGLPSLQGIIGRKR
jgi:hypothetical protein